MFVRDKDPYQPPISPENSTATRSTVWFCTVIMEWVEKLLGLDRLFLARSSHVALSTPNTKYVWPVNCVVLTFPLCYTRS